MSGKAKLSAGQRQEYDWLLPEPKAEATSAGSWEHVHEAKEITRPKYRTGKKETAVKVYTVNQESRYLVISNIPSIGHGTLEELLSRLSAFGVIEEHRVMDEVEAEPFTDILWVKYKEITAARICRAKIKQKPFYGHLLHIRYAPEYEDVRDVQEKLKQRKALILDRYRKFQEFHEHRRQAEQQQRKEARPTGSIVKAMTQMDKTTSSGGTFPPRPGGQRRRADVLRDAVRQKLSQKPGLDRRVSPKSPPRAKRRRS